MLTTSLPLLPPPSTSLLPHLHDSSSTSSTLNPNSHHQHTHQHNHNHRRHGKHSANPRSTLSLLSSDERTIEARKMAIAMYGYSWLKPAGCNKTMLGRREEELEREEVERQLREAEMQERQQADLDEVQRHRELMDRGEIVGEGERDLDGEIPDADEGPGEDGGLSEGEQEEGEDEEGMGDLDDEVPDAEPFVYDTRREPDTDEEQEEQEQLANEMLDEDELGEMDMARDLDAEEGVDDMEASFHQDRDLDDDVPEAEDEEDEGEWQHTDTELEDSEMDISLLPGQAGRRSLPAGPRSSMEAPGMQAMGAVRRVSGNAAQQIFQARNTGSQVVQQETPINVESDMSFGLSSGPVDSEASRAAGGDTRRAWLAGASARRNLFGGGRTAGGLTGGLFTPIGSAARSAGQAQQREPARPAANAFETPEQLEQPQTSPRRSGRLLDAMRRRGGRNDNRDSLD